MTRKHQLALTAGFVVAAALCAAWVYSHRSEANRQSVQTPWIVDSANQNLFADEFSLANDFTRLPPVESGVQSLERVRMLQDPPRRPTAAVEPMLLSLAVFWARKRRTPFRWIVAIGAASITLLIETRRHHFGTAQFILTLGVFVVLFRTRPVNQPGKIRTVRRNLEG
jgi:hypothetical protein